MNGVITNGYRDALINYRILITDTNSKDNNILYPL